MDKFEDETVLAAQKKYLEEVYADLADDPEGRAEFDDAILRDQLLIDMIDARGRTKQGQVASQMGTTQSAVSDLEKGKSDPRLTTLQRYARAVGRQLRVQLGEASGQNLAPDDDPAPGVAQTLRLGEDASLAAVMKCLYRHKDHLKYHSLAELADLTELPEPAVGHILSQLLRSGWLTEARSSRSEPARFQLRDERGLVIGVSVSGRGAQGVVTDLRANRVLAQTSVSFTSTAPSVVIEGIVDLVRRSQALMPQEVDRQEVGLGVALAGLIEDGSGIVTFAPDLQSELGWSFQPLEADLETRTGLRTVVSNDASALAIYEYLLQGEAHNLALVLFSHDGDGVGGGLVINGNLAHGVGGISGEIGHLVVEPDGDPCRCGPDSKGCLETVASPSSIVRRIAKEHPAVDSLSKAADMAEHGDPHSVATFEHAGKALGQVLASVIAIVGPNRLVILGPPELVQSDLHRSASLFLGELQSVSVPFGVKLKPEPKVLEEYAGAKAAAAAAVAHFLSKPRRWVPTIAPLAWDLLPQRGGEGVLELRKSTPEALVDL